jgi:allantoin racemase
VQALTARFGAPYISDELAMAVAGHALLDAMAAAEPADALLIGCFGDPGLLAARQVSAMPVLGLAEAAMRAAAERGPFAIATAGADWPPMLQRLATALGLAECLQRVVAVAPTGAELAASPALARQAMLEACGQAMEGARLQSIVVGGAALAGVAADLSARVGLPLIDSVDCGLRAAWAAAVAQAETSAAAGTRPGWPAWWQPWHSSCDSSSQSSPHSTRRE